MPAVPLGWVSSAVIALLTWGRSPLPQACHRRTTSFTRSIGSASSNGKQAHQFLVQWVYAPDQSTWEPEENLLQLPPLSGELFVATFREHVYRHLKPKKAASWYVEFYIEELRHPALALCVMNAIRATSRSRT